MRKFRNVTKKVAAFSLCGIMLLGLTACGAKASNDMAYDSNEYFSTSGSSGAWDNGISYDKVTMESAPEYEMKAEYGTSDSIVESPKLESSATGTDSEALVSTSTRKVIKTANLNLQTLDFDEFQAALDAKIAEAGAYLQYADVSGTDYYGGRKSANYTIRVPQFKSLFSGSGRHCNRNQQNRW